MSDGGTAYYCHHAAPQRVLIPLGRCLLYVDRIVLLRVICKDNIIVNYLIKAWLCVDHCRVRVSKE